MRKIIAITQVTLDGIMQSPGGPEEDPRNAAQPCPGRDAKHAQGRPHQHLPLRRSGQNRVVLIGNAVGSGTGPVVETASRRHGAGHDQSAFCVRERSNRISGKDLTNAVPCCTRPQLQRRRYGKAEFAFASVFFAPLRDLCVRSYHAGSVRRRSGSRFHKVRNYPSMRLRPFSASR
jgi:hypothetical protein